MVQLLLNISGESRRGNILFVFLFKCRAVRP